MANVRSPNRDFTLNVAASRISMSGSWAASSVLVVPPPYSTTTSKAQPAATTLVVVGGGPQSYPISG